MGFGLITNVFSKAKMDQEIAALRGGNQIYDRTGKLDAELAQKEEAIRAKYGNPGGGLNIQPAPQKPAADPRNLFDVRGAIGSIPSGRDSSTPPNNPTRPSDIRNLVDRIRDQRSGIDQSIDAAQMRRPEDSLNNADMPMLTKPLQQPGINQGIPDIGLSSRAEQRQAPDRGLISGVFRRLRLAPPSDIQRQNEIAQRLGGQQKQIDFDALKSKFRGMK